MPHGTFFWNELMTRDVERAKKFYADTIGWSFDGMPMPDGSGTYWIAKMGDQSVAGLLDISAPQFGQVPESWMPTSPSTTSMRGSKRRSPPAPNK